MEDTELVRVGEEHGVALTDGVVDGDCDGVTDADSEDEGVVDNELVGVGEVDGVTLTDEVAEDDGVGVGRGDGNSFRVEDGEGVGETVGGCPVIGGEVTSGVGGGEARQVA